MSVLLWSLCAVVLAVVVWLLVSAREDTLALHRLQQEFYEYLLADDRELSREALIDKHYQDVKAAYARKAARADGSDALLGLLEAEALGYRNRVGTRIELMPQIGLLGTVVGVIGTLVATDVRLEGLWTALITTALGLSFALAGRWLYELPAEQKVLDIMRSLATERTRSAEPGEGSEAVG